MATELGQHSTLVKAGCLTLAEVEPMSTYRQTSNISGTLIGNKIVHHSDVIAASSVGAAPTTSSFST